ncbi:hypothetical protein PYW08_006661 [Mythimna loreyi]|uniref:Uncharacterized protein n=1 Tax=Mythimna loreyi TaxID=667449 RepID=A0ACC2R7H8_9NEOP|nr:hypothetical protein PYW08_006661 [Mythimna loreyi]
MYSQCSAQVRSTAGSGACCRLQQQLQCGCRLTSRVGSQPLPLPDDNTHQTFRKSLPGVCCSPMTLSLEVQNRLEVWWYRLESVDLKLSRTKTEYLFCDFGGLSGLVALAFAGTPIPICSDFRYLESSKGMVR